MEEEEKYKWTEKGWDQATIEWTTTCQHGSGAGFGGEDAEGDEIEIIEVAEPAASAQIEVY